MLCGLCICMQDGSTCGNIDGQRVCVFAQVYTTGLEILPISLPCFRFIKTLFPQYRLFPMYLDGVYRTLICRYHLQVPYLAAN